MSTHRHVMNELLDTERAYVEELLCVLEVRLGMGQAVASLSYYNSFVFKLFLWLGLLTKTDISSNSGDQGRRRITGSRPTWATDRVQGQLEDSASKSEKST